MVRFSGRCIYFLELEIGMTAAGAGFMAGLFGIGQFLGRPAMGWLSDRISYRIVGAGSGMIMGLFLILILANKHTFADRLYRFECFCFCFIFGAHIPIIPVYW